GEGLCGLVFGTLLGPEATGPGGDHGLCGGGFWPGLFVSGFLAASIMRVSALAGWGVWGVWHGVVV
ncbi:hypothetical protein, partial [Arthrobacter sp. UYEF21]|uniref:hypothetical protein n=1 Tax=Arthrobacter sp. UYEF21 TaxID=1756364 RepID=UPI0033977CBD